MVNQTHRYVSKHFGVSLLAILTAWGLGCKTPPVVDQPAASFDVNVAVLDTTEAPSDGKVIAVMQFLQNGTAVQLASNVSATCNGVALPYNGLVFGHSQRVPLLPAGGIYNFRYTRGGVNTDVQVPSPARPVFAAPTGAGALLPRTAPFTIHYVPGNGASVRGEARDGTNSRENTQADNGSVTGLDVSGFSAGPGTLFLARTLQSAIPGTGFHSATNKSSTGKTINITWQ
jgi:hypothetical protein